jgi:tetratricopeptide (TPR) repeat protein
MRRWLMALIRSAAVACLLHQALSPGWGATGAEPAANPQVDTVPCMTAIAAHDDDKVVAICSPLIDNDKTSKADRVKALIARAAAYDRKDQIDRAIADDGAALRLDPSLADLFNARGELWRRKGDRPRALQDFAAAIKLNPGLAAAKANYKSLALELEWLGAVMAVNNRPSFNCAAARHPVEKAICANPDLVNLDRQIDAVNTRLVREANETSPHAGRDRQHEQDDFIARRNADFGRPDYDLQKAMAERLDHLLALARH